MTKVKMNCKALESFGEDLKKLQADDVDKFFIDAAKELAARLLAKVIPRTPVGDKPKFGEAKKSVKVKGKSGKNQAFLSREGAILQEHWSGYVGGTLRRGWTASTEKEAQSGGSGNSVSFAQSLKVEKVGSRYQITVTNPVSYASYVEYGHRQTPGRYVPALGKKLKSGWVNGQFMLTISAAEIEMEAPVILQNKLEAFLRGIANAK